MYTEVYEKLISVPSFLPSHGLLEPPQSPALGALLVETGPDPRLMRKARIILVLSMLSWCSLSLPYCLTLLAYCSPLLPRCCCCYSKRSEAKLLTCHGGSASRNIPVLSRFWCSRVHASSGSDKIRSWRTYDCFSCT